MEFTITKTTDIELSEFEAWSGAVSRLDRIVELGIEEEASDYISECLGTEIDETDLNDFLWFEMDEFIEQYEEEEEEAE
nr:MAG TPA: hypothetical protein [Herelleviridae sp.]